MVNKRIKHEEYEPGCGFCLHYNEDTDMLEMIPLDKKGYAKVH